MFDKESGLSRYIKLLLHSQFPASSLLNPDNFLKYLAQRGILVSIKNLEYFDKKGVLRPVLRVIIPKFEEKEVYTRNSYSNADIYALQYYYFNGLIELPDNYDYRPSYEYEEDVQGRCLYYHPYQIIQMWCLTSAINQPLTMWDIETYASRHSFNTIDDGIIEIVNHIFERI